MENKHAVKFAGTAALVGLLIVGVMGYNAYEQYSSVSAVYVTTLWHNFKETYIETSTGRTVSRDDLDSTSSQDQAFTMLRAVWMNDQATFDRSWNWTKIYLKQRDNNLFSSLYGKRSDGSYGIVAERGGNLTSSGADSDIALALLFAYARWGQMSYQESARNIMRDIWDKEVMIINNRPYLLAHASEKETNRSSVIINPSFYAIYAYRIFASIDRERDWNGVIETSYDVIEKSSTALLGQKKTAHIPPNWISIHTISGELGSVADKDLNSDFSTEALRVPWNLALDWFWFHDSRSKNILLTFSFLQDQWQDYHRISAVYSHEGKILVEEEDPAMYGGILGYFVVTNPSTAKEIQDGELASLYDGNKNTWKHPVNSFDATWIWMGLALMQEQLPNLFPQTAVDQLQGQFIREIASPLVSPASTSFIP